MPGDDKRDESQSPSATSAGQEAGDVRAESSAADESTSLSPHQLKRRRRYQQLAVACLLTAVFVGTVMWSRGTFEDPRDTRILAIAPSVLFDQLREEVQKKQLTKLHVTEFEVDDEMISQIKGLDSIEALILDKGVVTDESIETIATLPKLQHLRLRRSPIGDRGLKRLSKTPSLWYLNLPHAQCTAEGVAALAELPRLRQLRLGSPNLGNEVTREIATLTSLRGVHLIGVAVTDEGLKMIAAMPLLESLYLDDSAVTEAGWEWLFREHPHLHVHIDQAHHDRDPKAHTHH